MNFYQRLKIARAGVGQTESPALEVAVKEAVGLLLCQPTNARRPGMLLGKVQSGKTKAFLGILASAFDEGFDVAVVLTKGTRTLAKQTVNRIGKEYAVFRDAEQLAVYDIMSVPTLSEWEIEDQKLVLVAKKQKDNLKRLLKLFEEVHPALQTKRVLIIDDEADFASIRFTKKKGTDDIEQGRIADSIDALRRLLTNPAVLQVTATPYSLYLQPDDYDGVENASYTFEPKRPAFTTLVPIHSGYVGGDHYFGEHDDSQPEAFLWHEVDQEELEALKKEDRRRIRTDQALTSTRSKSLRQAIITFVVGACIRRMQDLAEGLGLKRYSTIVHVETSKSAHVWQETVATEIVAAMKEAAKAKDPIFDFLVESAIQDLQRSVTAEGRAMPDGVQLLAEARRSFAKGAVVLEKVNSDADVEALLDENAELRLRTPFNIFIGGQILDRGITVPNLIGFYYGRSPKRMQQDTVLQHARMYGNRPRADLAVTRFYTTADNYLALKNIHEFDSALRHAFETGAHDRGVAFVVKEAGSRVVPCAPNKIMATKVVALKPGGAHLPIGFQTKSMTNLKPIMKAMDALLPQTAIDSALPVLVPMEVVTKALDLLEGGFDFENGYSFDWEACRAAIEYFSRIAPQGEDKGKCWVAAKTGRKLSRKREDGIRYSNAPHTYQDRAMVRSIDGDLPVVVFFGQMGLEEDGWRGTPFWWPVLFAPAHAKASVFASTIRKDEDDIPESEEAPS